jgi:sugar lactone lactonase YvrE
VAESVVDVVVEGLTFPECPRWRAGWLWFSDMHAKKVMRLAPNGHVEPVLNVAGQPGGIGWLPDGRMLVVSMTDRKLLRLDEGKQVVVADLTELTGFHCNDMVVHPVTGRAYIGNYGFDLDGGEEPTSTTLVCVEPNGEAWVVVEGLYLPNGCAITPDGRTIVVAESFGRRLSGYDIGTDGSLSNPRVWADLRPNVPDGICLDAEGSFWVADPVNSGVMRVREGIGSVEWIPTRQSAYACELGGSDGKTLYVCTAETSEPAQAVELKTGRIEAVAVDVPGAAFA